MADEIETDESLDPRRGRMLPGPVTLATVLLHSLDMLYNRLIQLSPEGPERDLAVLEWANERDYYKPLLDRIIQRGR